MGSYAQMKQGARGFWNGALARVANRAFGCSGWCTGRGSGPTKPLGALVGARKRAPVTFVMESCSGGG